MPIYRRRAASGKQRGDQFSSIYPGRRGKKLHRSVLWMRAI
jgi:hypothetical protein